MENSNAMEGKRVIQLNERIRQSPTCGRMNEYTLRLSLFLYQIPITHTYRSECGAYDFNVHIDIRSSMLDCRTYTIHIHMHPSEFSLRQTKTLIHIMER